MKHPYLIELRLDGTAKHVCRKLTYDISKKFYVKGNVRKRPVPHITLFGPFNTLRIKDILQSIQEIGSKYPSLDYSVDGFDFFEKKRTFLGITTSKKKDVIFLKIKPSKSLVQCQKMIAKQLFPITNTSEFDNPKDKFHFHATLAMKDISMKFDKIWEYLENYEIKFEDQCFRLTILRDSKIMYEYDLSVKRLLTRRQALSRNLKNKIEEQRKYI